MIQKNQIKHIIQLQQKRYRHKCGEFAVEGEKCVEELLRSGFRITGIFAFRKWISANMRELNRRGIEAVEIDEDGLKKISSFEAPNKVLAVAGMPERKDIPPGIFNGLALALDDIRDPGNLGMIIRTADWFGIKNIVCSGSSVDAYNPKVVQSSMGSLFRVNIFYTDLVSFISNAPGGISIYGCVLDGDSLFNKKLEKNGIIIIGNESNGISENLLPLVKQKLTIPPAPLVFSAGGAEKGGMAESLNAALAAAIICYEFRRQNSGSHL